MAAEEGGPATKTTATSSLYGGGGAGGKFPKKPSRRQTTPYDRPPLALRGGGIGGGGGNSSSNNNNNSSWLTKLVVDPASKLISYGANRFFASVFRKRLPAPPPPPPPEVNHVSSDGLQEALPNVNGIQEAVPIDQYGAQEPARGECSQPVNSSSSSRISELEQLLKQKTFTRSEIDHLTELLQTRAREVPPRVDAKRNEETTSDFGRRQQFASGSLEKNRNDGDKSLQVMSTPVSNSKGLEDDIASPAELAKVYMGSRPSKLSPSLLGVRSQHTREDAGSLSDMALASRSPIMPLASVNLRAPENGFMTPRSGGRSALYNMARSPYSRVYTASSFKVGRLNNNGHAGLSTSSSSLSLVEHVERSESKQMTLKRRSSALDDDVGSVGPIRRIRQKANLVAPRIPHTGHAVRIREPRGKDSRTVGKNEDDSIPDTSYARVPSKSSEVAAKILQQLEKLSPKEKSSELKLVTEREKLPFKLAPSMLHGQALRSMEDVGSSKLLLDIQDDYQLENRTNATSPNGRDSSSQKQGKADEKNRHELNPPSDLLYPLMNNDSAVSLKASGLGSRISDCVLENGVSQSPQKKRAFRMSAQEDSFELDDDININGFAPKPFSDRETKKGHLADSKFSPAEEPNIARTAIQPEVKLSRGLASTKTSDIGTCGVEEGNTGTIAPSAEEANAAAKMTVLPPSIDAFNKPNEANNPPPVFSFSSKVADNIHPLSSGTSGRTSESRPETSNNLAGVSAPTGSPVKITVSDKGFHSNLLNIGDTTEKSDNAHSAINGILFSSSSAVSPAPAYGDDTNKISADSPLTFTPPTSIGNIFSTSTSSAPSNSSLFGTASAPSNLSGPIFKFSSSANPPSEIAVALTTTDSEAADLKTKSGVDSFSCSTSSIALFGIAASSGSSTFGLSSSTADNPQGSLFNSAGKSSVEGVGSAMHSTSVQVSSASSPTFNVNNTISFGSSLSNSQAFNPSNTFGFSSLASSSDTIAVVPNGGPTSGVVKFGAVSTAATPAVVSNTGAAPGIFSFGLSSSAPSTKPIESSSAPTSTVFSLGGSSSVSSTASFSFGTSGIFNLGGTSASVASTSSPSHVFGSAWQSSKPSIFGSTPTPASTSASSGFPFGASAPSPNPVFSFAASSSSAGQPVFGNAPSGFGVTAGNNNEQMNAEDSMAEDPVQSTAPSVPLFGQPAASPLPGGFMFGSSAPPSQANAFQFGGQQNQIPPPNASPFQASSSLEFNAGGSFSLGSGGGDKSGRKIVKPSRYKNRRK